MELKPEEWKKVESKVNTAEKAKLQAAIAKATEKKADKDVENFIAQEKAGIDEKTKQRYERIKSEIQNEGKNASEAFMAQAEELIGEDEGLVFETIKEKGQEKVILKNGSDNKETTPERALISLRYANLRKVIREDHALEVQKDELFKDKQFSLAIANSKLDRHESINQYIDKIRESGNAIDEIDKKEEELLQSTPEAFYAIHLRDIEKFQKDTKNGVIIETPYVKEQAKKIAKDIDNGEQILIYGHTGTGKTELAMHVARNYILKDRPDLICKVEDDLSKWKAENKDATKAEIERKKVEFEKIHMSALVISGSKHISLAEFYGHQVLTLGEREEDEAKQLVAKVEEELNEWKQKNPKANDAALLAKNQALVAAYIQNKSGTISDFFKGPIYKAMEEGRPLIIDEVNAIPHEVLISLNHILTRKVGDAVPVQQNSGSIVTIKKGFCVIMTGNLNTKKEVDTYTDRQELDTAFLGRLTVMEHDYVPQSTIGEFSEEEGPRIPGGKEVKKDGQVEGDEKKSSKKEGHFDEHNELFQIILSRIMDSKGNISVPDGEMRKLWNLAKTARVIQEVFSGKNFTKKYQQGAGGVPASEILTKNVASIRAVDKIISAWMKSGFEYELDYYIWDKYVNNSTDPTERALLYQIFTQNGFFGGNGWPEDKDINYGEGGKVDSFDVTAPKNKPKPTQFFGPRETIKFAFGKAPERVEWPEKKLTVAKDKKVKETVKNVEQIKNLNTDLVANDGMLKDMQKNIKK